MLGIVLGEFMMVTMFALTRKLTMSQQYWVPGIVVATTTLLLIFLLREPKIKLKKQVPQPVEHNTIQ